MQILNCLKIVAYSGFYFKFSTAFDRLTIFSLGSNINAEQEQHSHARTDRTKKTESSVARCAIDADDDGNGSFRSSK
jgi:hypothetical protein